MPKRPAYRTPYCLYCYAPMERIAGASWPCPSCGRANVKDDQRRYWTLERRLVELESLLMWLVTAVVVALFAAILLNPGVGTGQGHGMAVGLPILVGALGWDAVSALTRRTTTWRSSLVLAGIPGILGTVILLMVALGGWRQLADGDRDVRIFAIIGLILLATAFAALWGGRAFGRWRERRILRRQSVALARSGEAAAG